MSGHYPFSGKADRVGVHAFYERHGLGLALQERYYRWWYEWAQRRVVQDPHLRALKAAEFRHFPYGQHALHEFHLHRYQWCTTLMDLGAFIEAVLIPRLSDAQRHALENEHHEFLETLKRESQQLPREPVPEVGVYRHT